MTANTARAYTAYKPARQSKPKQKKYSKRSKRKLLQETAVAIIILFGALALAKAVQEALIVQSLAGVNEVREQIEKTIKQQQDFEYKLSVMEAPGRIKSIAINKLGMSEASKAGYIFLPIDGDGNR